MEDAVWRAVFMVYLGGRVDDAFAELHATWCSAWLRHNHPRDKDASTWFKDFNSELGGIDRNTPPADSYHSPRNI